VEVDSKPSVELFSSSSLKEVWPRCASKLLQLSVTDEEGLPRHLCKNCKAKVLSVEEKLQKLHTQAQHTLQLLEEKRSVREQAKDTSSRIVSPHTVAVCPAAKPQYDTLQRTLFSSDMENHSVARQPKCEVNVSSETHGNMYNMHLYCFIHQKHLRHSKALAIQLFSKPLCQTWM